MDKIKHTPPDASASVAVHTLHYMGLALLVLVIILQCLVTLLTLVQHHARSFFNSYSQDAWQEFWDDLHWTCCRRHETQTSAEDLDLDDIDSKQAKVDTLSVASN